jgi:hypothetical protein
METLGFGGMLRQFHVCGAGFPGGPRESRHPDGSGGQAATTGGSHPGRTRREPLAIVARNIRSDATEPLANFELKYSSYLTADENPWSPAISMPDRIVARHSSFLLLVIVILFPCNISSGSPYLLRTV